jgi:hypothetical protein
MVNVIVAKTRAVKVSANSTGGIIDTTTPVTVRNSLGVSSNANAGVTRLDKLTDVVANNETDNATLVYRAADDKYIVKQLDLDGGTF